MKITKLVLFITLSLLLVQMMAVSDLKASTMPIGNDDIQIKTKQGQIIKFLNDKVYVVGLGYALIEEFVNSNNIKPIQRKDEGKIVVQYNNLWQGVDLRYEERDEGLIESIYTIKPNADISKIKIKYNKEIEIQDDGKLKIKNEKGYFTLSAPIAWQVIDNKKSRVDVAFTFFDKHTVGYKVGNYDKRYTLIIDPVLEWNTFHGGGSSGDFVNRIAVSKQGNIYVVGLSSNFWFVSNNFPRMPFNGDAGTLEIVLVSLDNMGRYKWHSFFGSPFNDEGQGIVIDELENIYIVGYSVANWGAPIEKNNRSGGFVVFKVNSEGYLVWNTLLCTNYNTGENIGNSGANGIGVALDKDNNNVYVTGYCSENWNTTTSNRPPINSYTGGPDIMIAKLDNNGNLKWHTFYGGAFTDIGSGIVTDNDGNVYVVGSSDTPWGANPKNSHSNIGTNIVLLKLDKDGNYKWHSFYGGTSTNSNSIFLSNDNLYIVGTSIDSWKVGINNPKNAHSGGNDIVVMKVSKDGDYLWHTFYGSAGNDEGNSIAVSNSGGVYVAGYSYGSWTVRQSNPINPYSGDKDIVVLKLDTDGNYKWHGFYGSSAEDVGRGITVDSRNNIYIGGYSWNTWGSPINTFSANYELAILKIKDDTVTATYPLTVGKSGTGSGTVTSTPAGIDCGNTCTANFNEGTSVTLTATAVSNSTFAGWSGACSGTSNTCSVTMNSAKNVTATFSPSQCTYTISPTSKLFSNTSDSGNFTVTASPEGCTGSWTASSNVPWLTISSGGSGTGSGTVSYSLTANTGNETRTGIITVAGQNHTVKQAGQSQYILTVTKQGTGTGVVVSNPSGINCGASETNCAEIFGSNVTLTATPSSGSVLASWGGACSGTSNTCTVTMNGAKNVTATFNSSSSNQRTLTVSKTGTGSGTVTSTPAGIDCGNTCTANFNEGTSVTLTATAVSNSTFAGWSGACSGTSNTCSVTMNSAKNVTATFNSNITCSSFTISPQSAIFNHTGGAGNITITASPQGCSGQWTATTQDTWIKITPPNTGSGSGSISFNIDPLGWNENTRTGKIVVAGQEFTITQNSAKRLALTKIGFGKITTETADFKSECGGSCSSQMFYFEQNKSVTLKINKLGNSTFTWGGDCSNSTAECKVKMEDDKYVTITFNCDFVFNDVSQSQWANNYIKSIACAGITVGCGNNNYCPDIPVQRDQMAAFITRSLEGEPPLNYCRGAGPFKDVLPTNDFCPYIKRISELQINRGCEDGNYCPNQPVTRGQMAAFIIRSKYGEDFTFSQTPYFSDVPANHEFFKYVQKLKDEGITTVVGIYEVNREVTRAEMAAFLYRAFLR